MAGVGGILGLSGTQGISYLAISPKRKAQSWSPGPFSLLGSPSHRLLKVFSVPSTDSGEVPFVTELLVSLVSL